ncbi:EamA family transporter [Photobacterium sanguinicancri]|uniref:Multidrug transporter n=1 Tax=Photobacterium sanguinicancri TaxID=875932 RepID=A0ABX4G113_9GAMM|nr:EamA family transporter [Photobacterium sanguinicancri]OZS44701.1 multidrug transporter [Photobacterium sanguinicancri]
MSIFAVVLVVISAVIHASWNLLGKSRTPTPTFFGLASLGAGILLSPVLVYVLNLPISLPMTFWWLLLVSGFCQMVYMAALALAYQQADVGVVYPIARALPVLMVAVITALFGQSLPVSVWVGMVVVTLGCLLVPLVTFKQWHWRAYTQLGCLWALVAAIGTAGYSVIDKSALNILAATGLPSWLMAMFYLGAQFLATGCWLSLFSVPRSGRKELAKVWQDRKIALVTGVMMGGTYGLVLFAMTLTDNVSYIVALRQLSIPVGVALGIWLLKEPSHRPRVIGAALVCMGLMAVSLR